MSAAATDLVEARIEYSSDMRPTASILLETLNAFFLDLDDAKFRFAAVLEECRLPTHAEDKLVQPTSDNTETTTTTTPAKAADTTVENPLEGTPLAKHIVTLDEFTSLDARSMQQWQAAFFKRYTTVARLSPTVFLADAARWWGSPRLASAVVLFLVTPVPDFSVYKIRARHCLSFMSAAFSCCPLPRRMLCALLLSLEPTTIVRLTITLQHRLLVVPRSRSPPSLQVSCVVLFDIYVMFASFSLSQSLLSASRSVPLVQKLSQTTKRRHFAYRWPIRLLISSWQRKPRAKHRPLRVRLRLLHRWRFWSLLKVSIAFALPSWRYAHALKKLIFFVLDCSFFHCCISV
jgi:hypothetical protein